MATKTLEEIKQYMHNRKGVLLVQPHEFLSTPDAKDIIEPLKEDLIKRLVVAHKKDIAFKAFEATEDGIAYYMLVFLANYDERALNAWVNEINLYTSYPVRKFEQILL